MTKISLNETTSAFLRDYSTRLSLDVNECANEIIEQFMKEQEQFDKKAKARQVFKFLSEKSQFSLGDVTWTEEELYDL